MRLAALLVVALAGGCTFAPVVPSAPSPRATLKSDTVATVEGGTVAVLAEPVDVPGNPGDSLRLPAGTRLDIGGARVVLPKGTEMEGGWLPLVLWIGGAVAVLVVWHLLAQRRRVDG